MNRYELGTTPYFEVVFRDQDGNPYAPTTVTAFVLRPDGTQDDISVINNPNTGYYNFTYETVAEGENTYTFIGETPASSLKEVKSGFFEVVNYNATDIDSLIPTLRMYLGDWEEPYRYTTNTLRMALIFAVKVLMRRWRSKYKIENETTIVRNPNYTFEFSAPPTVQVYDEPAIVVQAAVTIKSGTMQEASWQVGSWKDDEIAVSNIEGSRSRRDGLDKDIIWLNDYFKRRLFAASKQSLVGFNYPPNWSEG